MRARHLKISAMALGLAALATGGCSDDSHDARLRAAGPHPSLGALLKVADVAAGRSKFRQCAACHGINEGGPDLGGPNLFGIAGKPMGQASRTFGYTAALRSAGGMWDDATLDAWIENPRALVPGTIMTFSGVPDPLDRADIIAYLKSQSAHRGPK